MAATIGNARSHLRGRWAISEGISDPNKTEIAIRQSIRQEIRQKLGSRLGSFRPHSKSTYTKIMAAVTLRATGGTIRGLAAFRRLELKSSGCVSCVANVEEAGEGSEIAWEQVQGDLNIYITQDGHSVSVPQGAEGGDPQLRAWQADQEGPCDAGRRKVAPNVAITETKHTVSELAAIGMLENSGAERRHEIGRVQFKKALSGGGKAYR
jgi:hypothetical protein